MATTTVSVKAITEDTVTVAGYGVVFGGADLVGDTFNPDTDFMLDLVPTKLVLYDHGFNEGIKSTIMGRIPASAVTVDEDGIWIEAELDRHNRYLDLVLKLIGHGAIGWSSGSVGHLTQRDGKAIKRWPIVEFSLTPTPAEPRTLGVEVLKALAESSEAIAQLSAGIQPGDIEAQAEQEADPPQDDRPSSAAAAKAVPPVSESTATEAQAMSEQDAGAVAVPDNSDILAAIKAMGDGVAAQLAEQAKRIEAIEAQPAAAVPIQTPEAKNVNVNKLALGDSERNAFAHFVKTGQVNSALKASNDTDMNVGTAADGGYAVPTGHHNGIIARLDEAALYKPLGVMVIPGRGTTVNVPLDAEADGEFVSTNEAATFDRDAPALGTAAMTLVKYTKRVMLSYELLEDEDSRLLAFLDDFVGRGMAKTHNSLLITEALANGTAALTLDNAASITAAEIPELQYKLAGEYDAGAVWVMRRAIEGAIRGLAGNNWQFAPTPAGTLTGQPTLFGHPVFNSAYMGAGTTTTKSLLYGNFRYMGMRLAPDITVLRDPYSSASSGQVVLHYYFRTVYKVLQAEAIVYATQA